MTDDELRAELDKRFNKTNGGLFGALVLLLLNFLVIVAVLLILIGPHGLYGATLPLALLPEYSDLANRSLQ